MAASKLCSIPNCDKPALKRGWCSAHYQRWWAYGDPLGGGTSRGEPQRYFRDVVLSHDSNECLLWPYGRITAGYGLIHIDGKISYVHRLVCEHVNGHPPSPKHEAAHSCGNGHLGCVAKAHMSWKTPIENSADKLIHGTHGRGERCPTSKLTEDDVRKIRSLHRVIPQRQIAMQFGVIQQTISDIQRRKIWSWLD